MRGVRRAAGAAGCNSILGFDAGQAAPHPASGVDNYGGLYSQGWFDLTGCATWRELTRAIPSTAPGEVCSTAKHDVDDMAAFRVSVGGIVFELEVADTIIETHSLSYDPSQHRWLRFREQAGKLYWDTSPDGATWTEQLATDAPAWVTQVEMNFGAGVGVGSTGHGRAEFDNGNVVVP
ncbi:MAG: hypothetical protein JRI23_03910 [Deltaproteobacteria bacterium]|jgi:hypothetical protein|nr:hypothetical protein [Deltaproteobacteria bacterium]MBW2530674.1 hypothetical protein [Deltaproteobacteria bacterium]